MLCAPWDKYGARVNDDARSILRPTVRRTEATTAPSLVSPKSACFSAGSKLRAARSTAGAHTARQCTRAQSTGISLLAMSCSLLSSVVLRVCSSSLSHSNKKTPGVSMYRLASSDRPKVVRWYILYGCDVLPDVRKRLPNPDAPQTQAELCRKAAEHVDCNQNVNIKRHRVDVGWMALSGPSDGEQRLGAESGLSTAKCLFQTRLVPPHATGHMYAITSAYTTFVRCSIDYVPSTSLLWAAQARDEPPCCTDEN